MRECFLFRSGGYRVRQYPLNQDAVLWRISDSQTDTMLGTYYPQPFDNIARLTVPQVSSRPFIMFDDFTSQVPQVGLTVEGDKLPAATIYLMWAARDDVQFGYPILPRGVPVLYTTPDKRKSLKSTRSAMSTRVLEKA